jgi:hypothetical protein
MKFRSGGVPEPQFLARKLLNDLRHQIHFCDDR